MSSTYVFLLFVNVADLEPDIFLGQRFRRVVNNVFEALRKSVIDHDKLRFIHLRPNFGCTSAAAYI